MSVVTVSHSFQVVIPKDVRDSLGVHPGDTFDVIQYEGRIEYIPVKSIRKMRGFLKGMDSSFIRESDCT